MRQLIALIVILFLLPIGTSYGEMGWAKENQENKETGIQRFGKAWHVATHPTGKFKYPGKTKHKIEERGGKFPVIFEGEDGVKATFSIRPVHASFTGVGWGVWYAVYDKNADQAYSVIFVNNRDRVGFPSDPSKIWDQLQNRFSELSKSGIEVSARPEENKATDKDRYDRTIYYDITSPNKDKKKGKTTVQLAERVVITPIGMVLIDVIGPDVQKSGASFLQDVTFKTGTGSH